MHLGPKGQRDVGITAARQPARLEPALKPYLHDPVAWKDAMRQPAPWYGSAEAVRIEYERRNGYRWYVDHPARLLAEDYPRWMRKWAPEAGRARRPTATMTRMNRRSVLTGLLSAGVD